MKKLVVVYFSLALLYSCDSTPIINGEHPFVVNEIVLSGDGMCEYFGGSDARYDANGFSGRPSILLPQGWYNIGDTIQISK